MKMKKIQKEKLVNSNNVERSESEEEEVKKMDEENK